MSKCQHCGATLVPGDRFCTSCGNEVESQSSFVIPDVETVHQPSGRSWTALIAIAALAVALLAGAAVLISNRGSETIGTLAQPTVTLPSRAQDTSPEAVLPQPSVTVTRRETLASPTEEVPTRKASLDPCDGEEFPFSSQLEEGPKPARQGRREVAAQNVQVILNGLGYTRPNGDPLLTDGWYGTETARAVEEFQQEQSIHVTGTVYAKTWPVLGEVGTAQGVC